jgi:hypothetical protein
MMVASVREAFQIEIIGDYSRLTMVQKRLNGLLILCIEIMLVDNIDLHDIIVNFLSQNVRRHFSVILRRVSVYSCYILHSHHIKF